MESPEETQRIALYLRLANSLRSRLLHGEWKSGEQLPTIEKLMGEYDVSRITVRQALELLSRDGLLSSARGRGTFVTGAIRSDVQAAGLRAAINDPFELGEDQAIVGLTTKIIRELPAAFGPTPETGKDFVLISKVHTSNGEPFALSKVIVPQDIYRRFPKGADGKAKILKLLVQYGDVRIETSRQEITVTFADSETAAVLRCPPLAALVKIRSWRFASDDRLVFATLTLYRGDRFIYDIVEHHTDFSASRTLVIPTTAKSGEGHTREET